MGKSQPKPHKPIMLQKFKFELLLKKVSMHVKLQRDRRQGALRKKEKQLLQLLNRKVRQQKDEYIKGSSIVGDQSFVDACNICMRFLDILKDKSINICESRGDHTKVQEIIPYLISVLWVGKPLNIPVFGELYNMMYAFYGPGVQVCIEQEHQVDAELKSLFRNLMPPPIEVNTYFRKFCDKYDLDVMKFNAVGHQAPMDDMAPPQPSYPGNNFGGQGGNQQQNMGGMGQMPNMGGMPGNNMGGGMQGGMGGGQQLPMQGGFNGNMQGYQGQGQQKTVNMGGQGFPQQQGQQQQNFQQPQQQQQNFQPPQQQQNPFGQTSDDMPKFDLNNLDNMQKFQVDQQGGQRGGQQQGQPQGVDDLFADIDNILANDNQQHQQQQQPNFGGYDLPQQSQAKPYVPQQPGFGDNGNNFDDL